MDENKVYLTNVTPLVLICEKSSKVIEEGTKLEDLGGRKVIDGYDYAEVKAGKDKGYACLKWLTVLE